MTSTFVTPSSCTSSSSAIISDNLSQLRTRSFPSYLRWRRGSQFKWAGLNDSVRSASLHLVATGLPWFVCLSMHPSQVDCQVFHRNVVWPHAASCVSIPE